MKKIIRACTVSMSIGFVKGMLPDLTKKYEVVLLASPGPEMEEAKKEGLARCIAVPMERHISPIKDFASLCKLIRVFRKERPDMVHSMTPKAGLLCMMAGWLTRVPVRIHTFTGLVFPTATGIKRRILMLTDSITCACATHIIPEGEGVKSDLLNNGITKKPIKVLGYGNVKGIDMQRFSRENLCKENDNGNVKLNTENSFKFLFVGRIVRDKGMNELMAAFDRLSKKYEDIRLVLVGPYEEDLDPIAEETKEIINNNPRIEAVGSQYGDGLIAQYAAANCFVFPSYREGFPNCVLEAGAMGLPSIVTNINGSREIITNGNVNENENSASKREQSRSDSFNEKGNQKLITKKNGIIIPPKDADALYEAMELMLTDEEMRNSMAKNARPMIAERFEQGFVRKCLYDFYDEILP